MQISAEQLDSLSMAKKKDFFDAPREASIVKTEIVAGYFLAWARIMAAQSPRIAYIDPYAGPGRYDDGTVSTPLLVLQRAINDPNIAAKLVSVFVDSDGAIAENLRSEVAALPDLDRLVHAPQIDHGEVNDDLLAALEEIQNLIPSLTFIDPFGYKGLTLRLIRRVVKDWGCETIFFFNYNRINAAITNPKVDVHMRALFGRDRLDQLRADLKQADKAQRPDVILRHLREALEELGAAFVLTFGFRRADGRLSHFLVHASKHPLAHSIMKGVMAGRGLADADEVPLFEHWPEGSGPQLLLAGRRLDDLGADLLQRFSGRTMTRSDVYDEHNIGTPFVEKNYRRILLELEQNDRIVCEPPASERPKGTMAKHVSITFPEIERQRSP